MNPEIILEAVKQDLKSWYSYERFIEELEDLKERSDLLEEEIEEEKLITIEVTYIDRFGPLKISYTSSVYQFPFPNPTYASSINLFIDIAKDLASKYGFKVLRLSTSIDSENENLFYELILT